MNAIKQQNKELRLALEQARASLAAALEHNEMLERRLSTAADKQILLLEQILTARETINRLANQIELAKAKRRLK